MTSARRVGTNESISTYGAPGHGRDYTAAATWEAATDIDCVAGAVSPVLEFYPDAVFDDTCLIQGAVTDENYFRIMRPAAGHHHFGLRNFGVVFDHAFDVGSTYVFSIAEDYFQLQDIGITGTAMDSNATGVEVSAAVATVVGVMVYDITTTGTINTVRGIHITVTDTVVIVDCSVTNLLSGPGTSQGQGILLGSGSTAYIYNTTVVGCQYYGIRRNLGTCVVKNCLVSGTITNPDFYGTFDASSDYNASSDTSAPGTNSNIECAFSFEDPESGDYHLRPDDGCARNQGTDMSSDAVYAYDDDVDALTITLWSIGFDSQGEAHDHDGDGIPDGDDSDCDGEPVIVLESSSTLASVGVGSIQELQIGNGALAYLGLGPIRSFRSTAEEAVQLRTLFCTTRLHLQQAYRWTFCLRRKSYAAGDETAGIPTWGFNYGFALPTDLIQLWEVGNPHDNIRYRAENKYLLVDDAGVDILYSIEETDIDKWSPLFSEAMELKLASRLAMTLLRKDALVKLYEDMFQEKIEEAGFMEDVQSNDDESYSNILASARRGFSARDIRLQL